jgi:non-ribosomal peptide synthetase component F
VVDEAADLAHAIRNDSNSRLTKAGDLSFDFFHWSLFGASVLASFSTS